jgi:cytochrome c-type biogenesis protein CcmE
MTRKQRRLILIGASLGVLAVAAALVLSALRDSIIFFNSPTDLAEKRIAPGTRMRIGGQGVVAEGKLEPGGVFAADTVLAKHDERYMPREVVDALKKSGRWQEGEGKSPGSNPR